jgi:hypothetical protein
MSTRRVPIEIRDNSEQPGTEERLQGHMEEFASHLDTARTIWRRYPELVEAPEFPDQFRAAFEEKTDGAEPGADSLFDELLVERGLLKSDRATNGRSAETTAPIQLPPMLRVKQELIDEQIKFVLADGFERLARRFADTASVQEMGILTGLLNHAGGGSVLEFLSELLCSAEEPKA